MDASVTWDRGWNFTGTADSGFRLTLGEPDEDGIGEKAIGPMELLLIGMAGCTGIDVISILEKKRQAVSGFQIRVHAERASEHPRAFTDVAIKYLVQGENIDPAAVEQAIELSLTKYCSATATLTKGVPIHSAYEIS